MISCWVSVSMLFSSCGQIGQDDSIIRALL
jgi:hypothetical protein